MSSSAAYRLGQSSGKAGLADKDKSAVMSRVYELSKDSKFFANESKKAAKTEERVRQLVAKYETLKAAGNSVGTIHQCHSNNNLNSCRWSDELCRRD